MKYIPKTNVRKRYTNNVSNLKQYRYYCKEYENPLSKELFNKVWVDFIEGDKENGIVGIIDKLIFENFEFILPFRMGSLRLKKKKVKVKLNNEGRVKTIGLPIDWKSSREVHKRVYNLNKHTRGYTVTWYWDKRTAIFENKTYCRLNIVRTLDRYLAKVLLDPENINLDYYE